MAFPISRNCLFILTSFNLHTHMPHFFILLTDLYAFSIQNYMLDRYHNLLYQHHRNGSP